MSVILKNNVEGFLATTISASDVSLVLQPGDGAAFPNPVSPDYFYATLVSTGGTVEVVRVTARAGDTLSILRGQDGTTANSFAAGSRLEMRVNAQSVIDTVYSITNYQGGSASNPTTRLDGSALQAGDFYFNTSADEVRFYNGTAWQSLTTGSIDVQNFVGNGVQTTFTLSQAPTGEDNTQVYIKGVYQQKDTYSISGLSLIFSTAPPAGTTIEVVTIEAIAIGQTSSDLVSYQPAGVAAVPTTVREKLRETVSVKDFGAVGDGVTDDTTALQNAVNYIVSVGGGALYFPKGTYNYTGLAPITTSSVALIGEGKEKTTLMNTSPTADGIIFGPAEGVATGNNQFLNRVEGIYFNRPDTTATAGVALTFRFCANWVVKDVRIAQHHNGMEIVAGQDWTIDTVDIYGMFTTNGWLSPKRAGTWLLRMRGGLKAGSVFQPLWQGRITNFNFAGGWNTENCVLIEGADGTMFVNGYLNGGRDSLVKQTGADQYKGYSFENTYFDGGRPEQNTERCFWIDPTDTTFNYVTLGSGCLIANSRDAVIDIKGDTTTRLTMSGVKLHGWVGDAPRIMDVDAPNLQMTLTGFQSLNSYRTFRFNRANVVIIGNGTVQNGGYSPSEIGSAVEIIGQVDVFDMHDVYLSKFGSTTGYSDTGTGVRKWVNNSGQWEGALLGLKLKNTIPSDDDVLSWYEKGIFTPRMTIGGSSTGITYSVQAGKFERIGNTVRYALRMVLTSKGANTGEVRITDLPFAADFDNSQTYPASVRFDNVNSFLDDKEVVADVLPTDIRFVYRLSGAQASLQDNNINNNTVIVISGVYIAD